jgi:geranylgeranyl diphosphate synthase, type I
VALAYEVRRATANHDSIPPVLGRHADAIAATLRDNMLANRSFSGKMVAYHMGWTDRDGHAQSAPPGKMVRPALCLWACEACGGTMEDALPAAACLEWVHNFTLVHDDIQDGDRSRRGRDTVWAVWGLQQGINAGDALFARAFATLAKESGHPQRRLRAVRLIANAVLVVVEGQALDLRFEGKPETTLRAYLRMIRSKTGALIGASLETGAVMADADASVRARLRHAGTLLGVAFQIRDDWLGTWGDPATTGKSSSGDLGRCKLTYPIVAGYAAMNEAQRSQMRELFAAANLEMQHGTSNERTREERSARIRSLLESAGGPALTGAAPRHFSDKAAAIVRACHLPRTYVDEFIEVTHYVANRCR